MTPHPHLFLGGHDLEMKTIAALGVEVLGVARVHDAGLAWGAHASVYEAEIAAVRDAGDRAILVELTDDLPPGFAREGLSIVDHHGEKAGADVPASLRQVFDLLGLPESRWTRAYDLVCLNDVGHMKALRAFGASAAEIRAIRDADRAAQGVMPEDEEAARVAIARAERRGALTTVRTKSPRTSPVADFLEPEYGGDGAGQLLVLSPGEANFFGEGLVIAALSGEPDCWYGGALPARGFWGRRVTPEEAEALAGRIDALVAEL